MVVAVPRACAGADLLLQIGSVATAVQYLLAEHCPPRAVEVLLYAFESDLWPRTVLLAVERSLAVYIELQLVLKS